MADPNGGWPFVRFLVGAFGAPLAAIAMMEIGFDSTLAFIGGVLFFVVVLTRAYAN